MAGTQAIRQCKGHLEMAGKGRHHSTGTSRDTTPGARRGGPNRMQAEATRVEATRAGTARAAATTIRPAAEVVEAEVTTTRSRGMGTIRIATSAMPRPIIRAPIAADLTTLKTTRGTNRLIRRLNSVRYRRVSLKYGRCLNLNRGRNHSCRRGHSPRCVPPRRHRRGRSQSSDKRRSFNHVPRLRLSNRRVPHHRSTVRGRTKTIARITNIKA